jgi:hypothetical protein
MLSFLSEHAAGENNLGLNLNFIQFKFKSAASLNMYPGRLGPMAVNLVHIVSGNRLGPECIALAGSLQRTAQRCACLSVSSQEATSAVRP